MDETIQYTHLASREASRYQQYFVKGATSGLRPSTAPRWGRSPRRPRKWPWTTTCRSKPSGRLCAYCLDNPTLLQSEREEDWAESRSRGLDAGVLRPTGVRAAP